MTKWIRADHAQAEKEAAVAAERDACAELVAEYENHRSWADWASLYSAIRIRADANTDPLAARDAQVRAEALREAAAVAAILGGAVIREDILALIPADQEGDE